MIIDEYEFIFTYLGITGLITQLLWKNKDKAFAQYTPAQWYNNGEDSIDHYIKSYYAMDLTCKQPTTIF